MKTEHLGTTCELPKPLRLPAKKKQFIDKIIRVNKISFPKTLTINEGYISSVKWRQIDTPDKWYVELTMVVKSGLSWASILVGLPIEELKGIFKKSFCKKEAEFLQHIVLKCGDFSFREYSDNYVHCKNMDLKVVQLTDNEMAKELINEYFTLEFLEYVSL
jgi:hypothetical protein